MTAASAPVFLLGAARSGTTWLAKILDSHPDVLYRHEPDIDRRAPNGLPPVVEADEVAAHFEAGRAYFQGLLDVRTVKAVGSLPVFPKRWDLPFSRSARAAIVYGVKAACRLPGLGRRLRRAALPGFGVPRREGIVPLIKSVSQLGRAALLVAAMPEARFLLVVRHPCGQVDSQLRGLAVAAFEDSASMNELPAVRDPRRFGVDPETFPALSLAERLAWGWRISNTLALEALADNPRAKVLRYEDVCADPMAHARAMLDFLGLPWHPNVERFVRASTAEDRSARYFSIMRNSAEAPNRWRTSLPEETQRLVLRTASGSPPGRLFDLA